MIVTLPTCCFPATLFCLIPPTFPSHLAYPSLFFFPFSFPLSSPPSCPPQLSLVHAREPAPNGQRGAVTAVASMQGYLLLAVARQLVVYHWTGSSLEEAAFFEAPMYITSMATVRGGGAGQRFGR